MKMFVKTCATKKTLLGIFLILIVGSPLSVSFTNGVSIISPNTALAQASNPCPAGYVASLPDNQGHVTCTDQTGASITVDQNGTPVSAIAANGTQLDANGKPVTTTTSCSSILAFMASPFTCMFRSLVSLTAATLIYVASWLLTVAGVTFNWLVGNTIVNFGSVYSSGVQTAVQTGWTAFRDIANILIIGIFTFIAICTILGFQEFNARKLLARVLIIAVLINFSLLFTKMVVDASNFMAGQIYSAAALGSGGAQYDSSGILSTNGNSTDANSVASAGIAGNFIYLLGVQSFGNAYSAVNNIAEAKDSGWIALLHGIFVFVILVGAAVVLFYGSFLLISRVILLIFLMFSASVAFASYLVPKWSESRFGWSTWWSTLVKCCLLAPVLMLLLWITLNVSYAIHAAPGSGSFGDMLANPANGPDIHTLINYCIILGLLFLSFKLSNMFAGKIAGFNWAAFVPALGLGALSRVTAFAGRQTIGRAGMYVGDKLQDRSKNTDNAFARRLYDFGAQSFKTAGKRDFNLMRTGFGRTIQKDAGIKKVDTLAGKDLKGFEGREKDYLKRTAEAARRMTLSNDQKKDLKEKGIDKTLRENADIAQQYAEAEKTQKESSQLEKTLKSNRDTTAAGFAEAIKGLEKEVDTHTARRDATAEGTPEREEATRDLTDTERRLAEKRREQNSVLNEQTQRIKEAGETSRRAGRMLTETTNEAEKLARESGNIPNRAYQSSGDIAKDLTKSSLSALLLRATAISEKGREKLADKAAKEAGKQQKKHHLEEEGVLDALKDIAKEDHGHEEHIPTPPPAAPSPGGGGGTGGGGH